MIKVTLSNAVKQDISKQGYKDNSPYKNAESLNINSPSGRISMDNVQKPLSVTNEFGQEVILQPNSGTHQLQGTKFVERPLNFQNNGKLIPVSSIFQDGGEGDNKTYSAGIAEEVTITAPRKDIYKNASEKQLEILKSPYSSEGAKRAVKNELKYNTSFMDSNKAAIGNAVTGVSETMQIPQSAMVEGIEYLRGNEYDFGSLVPNDNNLPRVPSDTFLKDSSKPVQFIGDMLIDPTLITGGAGLLKKGIQKGATNFSKSFVLDNLDDVGNKYLPNAHKLNPFAFKPNPDAYYRMIGKDGYKDAIESGVIRKPKDSKYSVTSFSEGKVLDNTFEGPYMVQAKDKAHFKPDFPGEVSTRYDIPIDSPDISIYRQDWLKGYKEVPKAPVFQGGGQYNSLTERANKRKFKVTP